MTKYLAFGWSVQADKHGPADELLGTIDGIDEFEDVEYSHSQENGTTFGRALEDRMVELVPNLMRGKTFPMRVYLSWDKRGRENAHQVVAYYEVPGS